MKSIDLVREFHARFGQPDADAPMLDSEQVNELRLKLLREETDELAEALAARDPVAVLDALTDLQYVLDGSYLQLGFASYKDAATAEVHRSNMSKLGEDGKPVLRADGKVTKGPRYEPPDLARVLRGVKVGDQVTWLNAYGTAQHGTIDEIEPGGRIHVVSAMTNTRGKRVARVLACWFDPHEAGRLTVKP